MKLLTQIKQNRGVTNLNSYTLQTRVLVKYDLNRTKHSPCVILQQEDWQYWKTTWAGAVAWQSHITNIIAKVNWQFTADDTMIKVITPLSFN